MSTVSIRSLTAIGMPCSGPRGGSRVAPPRSRQRLLAIEILPGADHGLARFDMVEIGGDQRLGGEPAFGDLPGGLSSGKQTKVGHEVLLSVNLIGDAGREFGH